MTNETLKLVQSKQDCGNVIPMYIINNSWMLQYK